MVLLKWRHRNGYASDVCRVILSMYVCGHVCNKKQAYMSNKHTRVFHPLAVSLVLQKTHWELLFELLAGGWAILPAPWTQLPPLALTDNLDSENKKV